MRKRSMGEKQIPELDLESIEQGSELLEAFKTKIREACETYGCFLLKCREFFPKHLKEDSFKAIKDLFDLPQETKKSYKNCGDGVYSGYISHPQLPLFESFGVDGANRYDVARGFTNLMWPLGNPSFCNAIHSTSSKMMEINLMAIKMIINSLGVNENDGWDLENTTGIFRLIKYKSPQSNDPNVALLPHIDSSFVTILCENSVQGLEILTKQGNYMQVTIPDGSFLVIIGELLKAWSNERIHALKHRVTMKGNGERYSYGLFLVPKPEAIVEVNPKLVDENHPIRYRPFTYSDYMYLYTSNNVGEALHNFTLL